MARVLFIHAAREAEKRGGRSDNTIGTGTIQQDSAQFECVNSNNIGISLPGLGKKNGKTSRTRDLFKRDYTARSANLKRVKKFKFSRGLLRPSKVGC